MPSPGSWPALLSLRLLGGDRGLFGLGRLGRRLARFRSLRAEALGKPIHAPFGVDQLLASGEERVTVVTDFEVQLGLGRAGLPRCSARATRLDVEILGVNPFLHGLL